MKIAIISDIHENYHNLAVFFETIKDMDIDQILCLWDLMNGWIASILAASTIPVFMVWWNNDWDKVVITKVSTRSWSNLKVWFSTFDIVESDNRRIFMTHYPMLAKPMAKSWDFDVIFYGHDHKSNKDKINNCLIINPWELSAHKTQKATFAVYDTKTNDAEIIALDDIVCTKTEKSDAFRKSLNFQFWQTKHHEY